MHRLFRQIRLIIRRNQIVTGMILAIAITIAMTSVSMYLYVRSGASGLDLSRPGFNGMQNNVQKERSFNFASTGKLSQQDYDEFVRLFDEQRAAINASGNFDDQLLSDEALGFATQQSTVAP